MKKLQHKFMRFEFKYWVTDSIAEQLMRLAAPYLVCDDWAPGGQRNTSLYLDSEDLDLVQLHIESAPDRVKLRIRAYGDPPQDPAFIEIKRKIKAVNTKRRIDVPLAVVPELLGPGANSAWQFKTAAERETFEHFLYLRLTFKAEPKVLVTCRREAYTSVDPDEGLRLTLDRDVCYQQARGYCLQGDPRAWTPLCGLGNYQACAPTLVEVKFAGTAPLWLADAVQRLGLIRCSYSKYISAMTFEGLGPGGLLGLDRAVRPAAFSPRSS